MGNAGRTCHERVSTVGDLGARCGGCVGACTNDLSDTGDIADVQTDAMLVGRRPQVRSSIAYNSYDACTVEPIATGHVHGLFEGASEGRKRASEGS